MKRFYISRISYSPFTWGARGVEAKSIVVRILEFIAVHISEQYKKQTESGAAALLALLETVQLRSKAHQDLPLYVFSAFVDYQWYILLLL